MPIQCPACDHEITTEGSAPRFCSQCGASLIDSRIENGSRLDPSRRSLLGFPENEPDSPAPLDATTAYPSATRAGSGRGGTVDTPEETPSSPRRLPEGSLVGPFRIDQFLGAGGMGTVYQATHGQNGQQVALKLLSRSVRTTDETVQRFQRESQIAASINHPRSTFVYGAGQHEGQFYITMELMTGGTLDDIVKRDGPIEIGQAVDYVLDMIAGLQAAHEVGIVHRDLKPSNCFIDQTGRVKIGDFGLAKAVMAESSLTQTGAFMGTPQYAAPEQLRTSEVDERADIYAIGGTLFYLLAGRPPFVGNAAQVISSIASEMPPQVSQLDKRIPRKLSRVIHQTLEKSPERRPENLDELRQMLLPYSTHGARAADPGRRLAAFFVDVSLIGLAIGFVSQFVGILSQMTAALSLQELFLANVFTTFVLGTGYFAVLESWFGTTLGKWLLGMRVSTLENLSPGFFSALLRASIMPGLSYLANSLPAYLMVLVAPLNIGELDSAMWKIVLLQFINLASWIPAALCFITARKANGFRGFHELVSGTRVVRVSGSLDYKPLSNVPITLPVTSVTAITDGDPADQTAEFVPPQRFEEFRMIGILGQLADHTSRVYLARDESLERDVWLFETSPDSSGITPARKSVARTGRLRILKEDRNPERTTVVTEAVKGMPLVEYIRRTPNLDWRAFRPLLQELINELDRSQEDGTLPEKLCLAQVWVDRTAHTKLLDLPIVLIGEAPPTANGPAVTPASPADSPTEVGLMAAQDFEPLSPLQVTKSLLEVFIDNQVVPAHVLTFREEIEVLRSQPDALKQIGQRVGELADLHSAWRWDDRIGVLAISAGLELSMSGSLMMAVAIVMAMLEPALGSVALTGFGVLSVLAFGLGAITMGGPVFNFFGVLVRENRSLAPASAFRCACRTWIAWLPWILIASLFCVLMEHEIASGHLAQQVPASQLDLSVLGMLLAFVALISIVALGALYSIFRPSRGLPDLICGTRLIRK